MTQISRKQQADQNEHISRLQRWDTMLKHVIGHSQGLNDCPAASSPPRVPLSESTYASSLHPNYSVRRFMLEQSARASFVKIVQHNKHTAAREISIWLSLKSDNDSPCPYHTPYRVDIQPGVPCCCRFFVHVLLAACMHSLSAKCRRWQCHPLVLMWHGVKKQLIVKLSLADDTTCLTITVGGNYTDPLVVRLNVSDKTWLRGGVEEYVITFLCAQHSVSLLHSVLNGNTIKVEPCKVIFALHCEEHAWKLCTIITHKKSVKGLTVELRPTRGLKGNTRSNFIQINWDCSCTHSSFAWHLHTLVERL